MRYQDQFPRQVLQDYAADLNYRAQQVGASGRLSAEDLLSRILESAGRCEWCGKSLIDTDFEIDHIYSLSRGGTNQVDNLAVACATCNRRKGDKPPLQFSHEQAARLGYQTELLARIILLHNDEMYIQKRLLPDDERWDSRQEPDGNSDAPLDTPPYKW